MRSALTLAAAVAVLALSATACEDGPADNPAKSGTSAPGTSSVSDTGKGESGTGEGGDSNPLASTDPCSLLTVEEAKSVHDEVTEGEPIEDVNDDLNYGRSCAYYTALVSINDGISMEFVKNYFDDEPDNVVESTIGTHASIEAMDGFSKCMVVIDVTDEVSVTVQEGSGTSREESCEPAQQLAALVEPKLPTN